MPKEVGRTTMDPEVKSWLKDGPVLGSHEPIHVQRAAHDRFIDTNNPPVGKVEHLGLDGPHGTIPIRCYHPSKPCIAEGAALVYLHGGGYIVGLLDQFDTAMRLFAENCGAQVYAVDYKLAPEYQLPVQIEEDEYVVRWLHEHAHERGIDPTRIALGGDSADTRAGIENDTAGVLLFAWCYIPQGVDYSQPYITPLNAPSHADLPKTLLVTCGFDMLRDVAHAYGLKLAAAGNDLTYVHYDDLPHGFIQIHLRRWGYRHGADRHARHRKEGRSLPSVLFADRLRP
jgi:acetyl esterase